MRNAFSSANSASRTRWVLVVAVASVACCASCANKTNDAQPVTHNPDIGGLASRAGAGTEAYVCNFGYDSDPGATITPVDLTRQVADTPITTGTLPDALAATPDSRYLLVADEGQDLLTVLDTSNGDVRAQITVGVEPDAVAVSPNGLLALVANSDDGTVTPVDLQNFTAGKALRVGAQPDAIAIGGPGGETAIVANLGSNSVTPIDLQTMTPGTPIAVGDEPDAIALDPGRGEALVTNLGSGNATFLDMTTLAPGPEVALGIAPTGVATEADYDSNGPVAWVSGGDSLLAVSFDQTALLGRSYPVGHLAEAVAITNSGEDAWVADNDPYITEIDLADGRTLETVHVGGRPSAIVIPPPYS
jgi:YVTN family beta-propeller protein